MAEYKVADLSSEAGAIGTAAVASVDPKKIASQLEEINDAIAPVLASADGKGGIGLQSIELSLTIGAEGGVWFVAKGSAEASITATFSKPDEA
jgi:hypothetical protein